MIAGTNRNLKSCYFSVLCNWRSRKGERDKAEREGESDCKHLVGVMWSSCHENWSKGWQVQAVLPHTHTHTHTPTHTHTHTSTHTHPERYTTDTTRIQKHSCTYVMTHIKHTHTDMYTSAPTYTHKEVEAGWRSKFAVSKEVTSHRG